VPAHRAPALAGDAQDHETYPSTRAWSPSAISALAGIASAVAIAAGAPILDPLIGLGMTVAGLSNRRPAWQPCAAGRSSSLQGCATAADKGFVSTRELHERRLQMNEFLSGMVASAEATGPIESIAWKIGVEVAGPAAEEVDRESRFPREAVEEFKRRGLLTALIPEHLGGGGASLAEVAGAVRAVAFHCVASALVLAMHSMEVSNLVRHGLSDPLQELLAEIAAEQLLVANANSEVGIGGDAGRSICAVEQSDGRPHLEKQALAISYGEYADVISATARRGPDSEETDQVQVICRRGNFTLEQTSSWNAIGLRGTCSNGFRLIADVDPTMINPVPFATIASNGGIQATTILLSAAWVGLADGAAAKAHDYVRAAARRNIGTVPPGAGRLAELAVELQKARSMLTAAATRFATLEGSDEMESPTFISSVRNLKVGTSELAVRIATAALEICGIAGFKRDTPFTLDRQIRDAHGALVMVSNERYLRANAEILLARKQL
jgi:acyl-CoA dehydrogenase